MALEVRSSVVVDVRAREYNTDAGLTGGPPAKLPHPFRFVDDTDYDIVWSDTLSLTTSPTDIALDALTSKLNGAAVAMGSLHVVAVRHVSGAGNALVGADASAPVALTSADDESITVRPGGAILLDLGTVGSPIGASNDTLQLAASAGTVVVEVLLLGHAPA